MSVRVKALPMDFDKMSSVQLNKYAKEMWEHVVTLEKELYDLQERQKRQDYDVRYEYCYWSSRIRTFKIMAPNLSDDGTFRAPKAAE